MNDNITRPKTKDDTVIVKIDSNLKKDVEIILNRLGLNHSLVVNMLYNQIYLKQCIPFELSTMKIFNNEDFIKANKNKKENI